MKNKLIICLLLVLISNSIKAQYIGAQLGTSYFIGLKLMPTIGVHVNAPLFDQNFQFGFNYHLPIKLEGTDYATEKGTGNQIDIPYTDKISVFDLHILYRYYFNDNEVEDGGWYALGGGTLGIGRSKITPGVYDPNYYTLSDFFSEPNSTFFQPYLTLGMGFDKVLDNDHILGFQINLNLNSTNYNSRTGASGDISMPSFLGLRATYSLPIGQ